MYVIAGNGIHIFKKLCWRCINKTVLDSQKHKILWAYVNCCVSVMPSFNKFLNSSLFTLTFIVHGNGKKWTKICSTCTVKHWGPPRGFGEQGNKTIYFRGTREQKSKTEGNRRTNVILGNKEHRKSILILGNKGNADFFFQVNKEIGTPSPGRVSGLRCAGAEVVTIWQILPKAIMTCHKYLMIILV